MTEYTYIKLQIKESSKIFGKEKKQAHRNRKENLELLAQLGINGETTNISILTKSTESARKTLNRLYNTFLSCGYQLNIQTKEPIRN